MYPGEAAIETEINFLSILFLFLVICFIDILHSFWFFVIPTTGPSNLVQQCSHWTVTKDNIWSCIFPDCFCFFVQLTDCLTGYTCLISQQKIESARLKEKVMTRVLPRILSKLWGILARHAELKQCLWNVLYFMVYLGFKRPYCAILNIPWFFFSWCFLCESAEFGGKQSHEIAPSWVSLIRLALCAIETEKIALYKHFHVEGRTRRVVSTLIKLHAL